MGHKKEEKWYHIWKSYVIQHRLTVLMFLLFFGIFAVILSLYRVEIEAVLYASALCLLLSCCVVAVHFYFYYRGHLERREILQNILILAEKLPEPQTLAEREYQEMIRALKAIDDGHLNGWQSERQESLDYYTTWVHQIKTPIAVMRMTLQSEDTEEHRELDAELFRIEQYVEMVLSYIRLGNGSSDFVFQEYDLDGIIRQAVRKYAPQFVRKRIRLEYEAVSVKVLTDEKWLLFMLEQILSNAVKYAGGGTVSITVSDEKVLEIADTGIGIAPEDVPRIFEKGFTGYNGRAEKKSTGLGLYLVKRTAEKLGHRVSARSAVGQGTTISIDLHTEELEVE